ncbi:HD domain-containing protein [Halopenitus sp. POP-27]|uniref:HD domain-containing protein n=1 Tax=Halopenitus sp. POP-27 TaxID=2994425 RepID=UPI0024683208|nr:HD domain-containing protein [Halopenitus sp. POP-27]
MVTIKDSVHDHIRIDGVAADLLDTPAVQRLRRISQLGTVTLVYPSANHTRFEHSLGVYHLASRALDHLGIGGIQADRIEAAAILHDVGHAPFSHNVESLLYRHTGKYHDDVADLVAAGAVGDVLRDHDLDPGRIADIIAGEGRYAGLVSGELDVDRMDYLVRDAHHTGVPYGTIDTGRLVRELTFVDDTLVLDEGNVQTAESLLLARALMNPVVYTHHVARISKAMLRRATARLLETPDVTAEMVRRMDDHELIVALRRTEAARPIIDRYDRRDLYKRAVWAEYDDVPATVHDADHDRIRELEREIAATARTGSGPAADADDVDGSHDVDGVDDVDDVDVILDVPPEPSMRESTSRVTVNGDIRRLGDQSPLVSALRTAQRNQWRLGVYCPEPLTDRVGRAAADVLGLDPDSLISDVRHGLETTLDEFEPVS